MADTKAQTIFRVVGPNRSYTKLSNTLLADRKLSLECKGMLVSVLMLPTNWAFNVKWFRDEFGLGRDKAYALIREAAQRGYCRKVELRSGDGSMARVEYQFSDDPTAFPPANPLPEKTEAAQLPDLPDTAATASGKSGSIERTVNSKNNLEMDDTRERVALVKDQIQLCSELEAFWLGRFDGDAEALALALVQAAGYLQPNSQTRSLETQVSAQLARMVRESKDRDRRYASAVGERPQRAAPGMTNFDRKIEGARRFRSLLRNPTKEIAQ